jgi:hypothetical protein
VTARLSVTNNSGQRRAVRLVVRGGGITIPAGSAVHEVEPGNSDFTVPLVFAADSPTGLRNATLLIVDDDDPETEFNVKPFSVTVAYPEPPVPWLAIALGVLAAAAAGFLVLRVRSSVLDRRLGRLVVHVINGTGRNSLPTESPKATEFRFTVTLEDGVPWPLPAQQKDAESYVLRRRAAALHLDTPYGTHHEFVLEEQVELSDGLRVSVFGEPEFAEPVPGAEPLDGSMSGASAAPRDPML